MRALALAFFGFAAVAPSVLEVPPKPHPVALRRERLTRQFSHTRKGHR